MIVMSENPLVEGVFPLERFPGKGGWTYAALPGVMQDKSNPFGWVKVRGTIDDHELEHYKLMPMGNGRLFLPVKAAIRKKIRKNAGDQVRIVLYRDDTPLEIPEELIECFQNEPAVLLRRFNALTEGQRKTWFDHIYDARTEETKARRIAELMEFLEGQE